MGSGKAHGFSSVFSISRGAGYVGRLYVRCSCIRFGLCIGVICPSGTCNLPSSASLRFPSALSLSGGGPSSLVLEEAFFSLFDPYELVPSVSEGVGNGGVSSNEAVCVAGSGSLSLPVTMSASQSPRPPGAASMAVWGQ